MPRKQLRELVLLALLTALIVLLGFTPLGLIPLGFINVTILCVPVVVGTLYLGLRPGLILGLAFGLTSFASALLRPSALVSTLLGASPALVAVMSVLPRLLVPVTTHAVGRALARRRPAAAAAAAAAAGSLTNTVCYLGLMLLFYLLCGIDTASVLALIGGTALLAGGCEAAVAAAVCAPVLLALRRLK